LFSGLCDNCFGVILLNFQINEESEYKQKLEEEKAFQRAGMHSFHRYYGKLIPAIPSLFIKEFTKKGDLVFDPFSGSGTTAVESLKNGRNFVGFEINPLSQTIAETKTRKLNVESLRKFNDKILDLINTKDYETTENDLPYLVNRDHWFKDFVQKDLIKIKKAVDECFSEETFTKTEDYKQFYYMTISAILRNVSNADTQHVFPGISKRMRRLEEEGKIHIDVRASFERAIKKRAEYYNIYTSDVEAKIILDDSSTVDVENLRGKVDLIVTNPPYISSVRYIETLKIEMYWMEYIKNNTDYFTLADKMLGNDHLCKKDYANLSYTNYDEINELIDSIKLIDKKSAKIIGNFFNQIEKVIEKMSIVLKTGGKAVIKISDSKIKKQKVETGRLMTLLAENYGFKLKDIFLDEINNNRRSLTTARNTYSDIITHDYIIIWEKF